MAKKRKKLTPRKSHHPVKKGGKRPRKIRPDIPKSRQKWFDRPMSKTGRKVVEELNDSLGRSFPRVMRYAEEAHDSLTQQEFIDAMTSGGMSEHEAYTLWHSPPMG